MKIWLKILIAVLLSLAVITALVVVMYHSGIDTVTVLPNPVAFNISKGDGVKTIGLRASQLGLISSPYYFETYVYLNNDAPKLKAGDYVFAGPISIVTLVDQLMKGNIKNNTKKIRKYL